MTRRQRYALRHPAPPRQAAPLRRFAALLEGQYSSLLTVDWHPGPQGPTLQWHVAVGRQGPAGPWPVVQWTPQTRQRVEVLAEALLDGVGLSLETAYWTDWCRHLLRPLTPPERARLPGGVRKGAACPTTLTMPSSGASRSSW